MSWTRPATDMFSPSVLLKILRHQVKNFLLWIDSGISFSVVFVIIYYGKLVYNVTRIGNAWLGTSRDTILGWYNWACSVAFRTIPTHTHLPSSIGSKSSSSQLLLMWIIPEQRSSAVSPDRIMVREGGMTDGGTVLPTMRTNTLPNPKLCQVLHTFPFQWICVTSPSVHIYLSQCLMLRVGPQTWETWLGKVRSVSTFRKIVGNNCTHALWTLAHTAQFIMWTPPVHFVRTHGQRLSKMF